MAFYIEESGLESLDRCHDIFVASINELTADDYSEEERKAWIGDGLNRNRWEERMSQNDLYLVKEENEILAFAEYKKGGIIDMLYVDPKHAKRGVGTVLLDKMEELALAAEEDSLSSYVSITSRPFFEKFGFELSWENKLRRGNQMLINFLMVKELKAQG